MENKNKIRIVILAAGKGTRMKSSLPKVLAPLKGQHLIRHLLESVEKSQIDPKPIIVVGYEKDLVMKELGDKYQYVIQEEQLGTGHAVYTAKDACGDAENIIVISGDQPYFKTETIRNLLEKHLASGAKITILTTEVTDFNDWRSPFLQFGRILRKDDKIIIREFKDATEEEKKTRELNVLCYAFEARWLWNNLKKVNKSENVQKEYYLTDLLQIAGATGEKIEKIKIDPAEALGANSKEELEILEKLIL